MGMIMVMIQKIKKAVKFIVHVSESSYIVSHCRDWTANIFVRYLLMILVFPFSVFKYFRVKDVPGREGLAFVLEAKNEAPYIEEWINFHRKQGVSHFIIYDNESEDNLREVLTPYIESGLVTYHTISGRNRQIDAYNIAIHDYGHKFRYMGFIDADEFVFVRNNTYTGGGDLYAYVDGFMKAHPDAGGIVISWVVFGSNGHITKPEGGVLENYTTRAPDDYDHWVKSICDPMRILDCVIHIPVYRKGFYGLDETGERTGCPVKHKHLDHIRINHYVTKSREEFIAKRERGKADQPGKWPMSYFDSHNRSDILDTEILSYR